MKRTSLPLFVLAAAFAAGAALAQGGSESQSQDPGAGMQQGGQMQTEQTQTKEQKKAAWQKGVKQDCTAEIASGGVCEGKDFDSGLVKCLQQNKKSISDGCRAAIRPVHRKMWKHKGTTTPSSQGGEQTPSAPPQQ